MRITFEDWSTQFKRDPIVKVDGVVIRNVTVADDELGMVKHIKGRKQLTIVGTVEIIGLRK